MRADLRATLRAATISAAAVVAAAAVIAAATVVAVATVITAVMAVITRTIIARAVIPSVIIGIGRIIGRAVINAVGLVVAGLRLRSGILLHVIALGVLLGVGRLVIGRGIASDTERGAGGKQRYRGQSEGVPFHTHTNHEDSDIFNCFFSGTQMARNGKEGEKLKC